MVDFQKQVNQYQKEIEKELLRLLHDDNTDKHTPVLQRAMQYSVEAGGKRIRPVLSLAVAEMLHMDMKFILPFACSLELIHTYSLIHDDLPAMDNDDYRRGKPTNHKVFGEAIAILAGDALLNKSYEIMMDGIAKLCTFDLKMVENGINASHYISMAAGSTGMIGGQVIDMMSEGAEDLELIVLKKMHSLKTGALIRAAIVFPAILSGAGEEVICNLTEYAEQLGLCFQISDDILDIEGTEILGKPIGSDVRNHKTTYVSLLGMKHAKEYLKNSTALAIEALQPFGEKAAFLKQMAQFIATREY